MNVLAFILQILALICLTTAALGITTPRVASGWLGLALWLLSLMVGGVELHPVH